MAGRLWGHRARGRRVHKAGDMGRYISLKKQEVNSRALFFFEPSCPEGSLLLVSSSKLSRRKL